MVLSLPSRGAPPHPRGVWMIYVAWQMTIWHSFPSVKKSINLLGKKIAHPHLDPAHTHTLVLNAPNFHSKTFAPIKTWTLIDFDGSFATQEMAFPFDSIALIVDNYNNYNRTNLGPDVFFSSFPDELLALLFSLKKIDIKKLFVTHLSDSSFRLTISTELFLPLLMCCVEFWVCVCVFDFFFVHSLSCIVTIPVFLAWDPIMLAWNWSLTSKLYFRLMEDCGKTGQMDQSCKKKIHESFFC